jgi:predicted AlkP superfamily pyrophosphatase or phosphodiesterase
MPFKYIDYFNYCEQNDIFAAGGLNRGKNITDYLEEASIPYHISNWRDDENTNLDNLRTEIKQAKIRFAFLYMASMDGLLHQVGKEHQSVDQKLAWYEEQLKELIKEAYNYYDEVRLFVCSDHGMATVDKTLNLMPVIESLGWEYGKDYVAAYDSTMARFWFSNATAKASILSALSTVPEGRVLNRNELKELGCAFDGNRYGDTIFLVEPGTIICPSHMGTKPIKGMHGYHPDHEDSDAVLLSNKPSPVSVSSLTDICDLMRTEAGCLVN